MSLIFDLISDLHVETWPQPFDWTHRATSAMCVIAGDVCRDREILRKTLTHLGECYQAVFYIDGNDEHHGRYVQLGESYRELTALIKSIPNVVYLQDNVVIIDQVAIVGTNGWWNWNFDPNQQPQDTRQWWYDTYGLTPDHASAIEFVSNKDSLYLQRSIMRLQHESVKHIVMVTHTVPFHRLIAHDIELSHNPRFNVMGSDSLIGAIQTDALDKLHTWCFGHYHGPVDQIHYGIRFINNCRGRYNTDYYKSVYNPMRVVVDD
jgi:predicted phosphohydrolase